ncbi:MAG: D-alanyl-D-alanine carboxypeptidase, partial [Gemmatimonadetes bacterium]|nr:D-alanyl-D-alanine carboxypeptidase [Gemmatimonadota bacterium]
STPYWAEFLGTLPEAGVRRELGRMYRSPAAGNLRAKTGTMDGVSALSGLVRTPSGERVLFSILSNEVASEYRAKRAEDRLGIRLASLTRPSGD